MNAVIKKDVNEDQIVPMVRALVLETSRSFIEYMDVGTTNDWNLDHVVSVERCEQLKMNLPLQQISHFTKVMLQRCIPRKRVENRIY